MASEEILIHEAAVVKELPGRLSRESSRHGACFQGADGRFRISKVYQIRQDLTDNLVKCLTKVTGCRLKRN